MHLKEKLILVLLCIAWLFFWLTLAAISDRVFGFEVKPDGSIDNSNGTRLCLWIAAVGTIILLAAIAVNGGL